MSFLPPMLFGNSTEGSHGGIKRLSLLNQWNWYQRRKMFDELNSDKRRDRTYDNSLYNRDLGKVNASIDARHATQQQQRDIQNGLVDQTFNDPARGQYYDMLYGSALGQSLGQLTDQYTGDARNAVFNAAGRGVLGGSQDLQNRAGIERALGYATIGAENDAFNYADNVRQNDNGQMVNLQRMIESGNPEAQAAVLAQTQGIGDATRGLVQRQQVDAYGRALNQQSMNNRSQLLGNALGWAGQQYQTDQMARAQGGQGLSYVPQFGYSNQSASYGSTSR